MIGNIRRLFKDLDNDNREKALLFFKEEFMLDSRKYALNVWIIGGRIPDEYQERVVLFLQNLARVQSLEKHWSNQFIVICIDMAIYWQTLMEVNWTSRTKFKVKDIDKMHISETELKTEIRIVSNSSM
mgnify:FL=1